jgi:hypothetical protein
MRLQVNDLSKVSQPVDGQTETQTWASLTAEPGLLTKSSIAPQASYFREIPLESGGGGLR